MHFLITGAGPVGRALSRELAKRGHTCTIMTRRQPQFATSENVDFKKGDATHSDAYPDQIDGIAHCIHAPYDAQKWRDLLIPAEETVLKVATRWGIPVVFPESMYGFDQSYEVISPDTPLTRSRNGKPGVRATLIENRLASPSRTTSVIAADLYGPDAGPGCVYHQLIIGKKRPLALFNAHAKHSVTYLPDFARALADALLDDSTPPIISTPCAPALTQAEFARRAGCQHSPITIHPWMLKVAGVASTDLRGLKEMRYLWDRPSILTGATSSWQATPTDEALEAIYQAQLSK